jgi:hypothetical protein
MPRKNTNEEVFDRITKFGLIRDKPTAAGVGDSTLAAAATAGATTVTVQTGDGADFVQGELVRIGSGDLIEENVVESVAVDVLTLRMPVAYAHAIGEAVRERARVNIGEPSEEGVAVRSTADLNPIRVATSFRPYKRLLRGAEYIMETAIRNFSMENLAAAAGIPESNISGAGTTASPYALRLLDTLLATETNLTFYAKGLVVDGTTYEVQGWGVDVDPAQELQLRSGEGTPIRFSGSAKGIQWTSPALP